MHIRRVWRGIEVLLRHRLSHRVLLIHLIELRRRRDRHLLRRDAAEVVLADGSVVEGITIVHVTR